MSRNNVRGPTSALTEFLRAQGITPTTVANRAATRQNQNQGQQAEAGPSRSNNASPNVEANERPGRRRRNARPSGYNSDDMDEGPGQEAEAEDEDAMDVDQDEEEAPTPAKKRKLTKAAEAKLKAKEKEKMKKKKGKKGSDDDYEDDEDDAYTALSKGMFNVKGAKKAPVGSFEECAVCEKQFTVTKYTLASRDGKGFLCHPCSKAGGRDPFKKPALPKKKRTNADKRNVTSFEERRFPTLVSLCIQLITKHIDDIDALGDIGALNMEAISKALSKNRGLTIENAHLFYSPGNSTLTLFDTTNLPPAALETLVHHNANLVSLRLDFCGQLNDAAMQVFSDSLPLLRRIELLGPFLVRTPAWQKFFESHPDLEGFMITQSPRFDEDCARSLVKNCPNIKELRLKEIGKLNDTMLKELQKLTAGLSYLDLSDPSRSCSEDAMIDLIAAVGPTLTHLNVSKHSLLTDAFLLEGLLPHVTRLRSLVLSYLPELTDKGVAQFFNEWKNNTPLEFLDISRNEELQNEALKAILLHSGKKLQELNINGMKDAEQESIGLIGSVQKDNPRSQLVGVADTIGGQLRKLDLGWCRSVDDFIIKQMIEGIPNKRGVLEGGCKQLEEIKVWGCNRVSVNCPRRKGLVIYGIESHQVR
ncbi:hypothetical protein CVT24_007460 [Panaeolus cyanescens]|uniref:DNA repair protein rhp7 treble clef domain-containing protein n=1 Tax=Panaeolus cyanescens TaxID=181874 RepID=A0A409W4X9_9AGAR|nr:hypothetical protein CVT24_007460 [Panaeolus cyanescens]